MSDTYPGRHTPATPASEHSVREFHIQQVLSRARFATLVQVKKVTNTGTVEKTGTVDVIPLVNMQDGQGKNFKHVQMYNLPYFRLGAGDKAVIMDPKVDDIGIAVFADRDISTVKKTRKQGPPGSRRRNSMADGLFIGIYLGDKPKCYVRFTDDDKIIVSPDEAKTIIQIEKDKIKLKAQPLAIYLRPTRIDLGKLDAPYAVVTSAGDSQKVFAVISEDDGTDS